MNRLCSVSSFHGAWTAGLAACLTLVFTASVPAQKIVPPESDGVQAAPNIQLNNDQLAARFLDQATAGATPEEVASLSAALNTHPDTAFSEWINDQYAKPISPDELSLAILRGAYDNKTTDTSYRKHSFDAQAIRAGLMISDNEGELRRMVAYALSQIFVISDQDNTQIEAESEGMCDWYDLLYRDAFSDFSTILTDVTYHPIMSDFLSSEGNARAGFYNKDSRPDENYAREVMQLFTIGLVQLNEDGSIVVDGEGHAIPTYTQPEITEVARVFTGLVYPNGPIVSHLKGTPDGVLTAKTGRVRFGRDEIDEKRHDTGLKRFLGTSLPSGQTAEKDIADFLKILCNHPNTAPFFARGMIQRLVTSNPSPAYIKRVAEAFKTSNGDMKTVISAILLDDEARNPSYAHKEDYGKLREPWLRLSELSRAFHSQASATQPAYPLYNKESIARLGEFPLSAPSVFNFYLPNYQPPGIISERNANATDGSNLLVAPEFQIVNSNTALTTPNYFLNLIKYDPSKPHYGGRIFALDLTPQINLAGDPAALVNNVSTLLTGGTMSDRTRDIIIGTLNKLTPGNDPEVLKERARTAVYLTMISPDYAVQK